MIYISLPLASANVSHEWDGNEFLTDDFNSLPLALANGIIASMIAGVRVFLMLY